MTYRERRNGHITIFNSIKFICREKQISTFGNNFKKYNRSAF